MIWRAKELSKLEGPKAAHPGRRLQEERGPEKPLQGDLGENVGESCVVEYDDECDQRDYCVPEDESESAKGDYVSLVDNPERFTGYAGKGVWDAIYRENCFSKDSPITSFPGASGSLGMFQAANDLRSVIQAGSPSSELFFDDDCLEKRVFHRIISGMHASISTHICIDYLNQSTGEWGPNLQCYHERLAPHPERISNLYFNYALLLRAFTKLRTYLRNYTFCSGDPEQDALTKFKVLRLADSAAAHQPNIFDETTMFQDPNVSLDLKEDFRNRFRNVSRLMDCVGCDKCRLWGKLQTVGYGTALKVLFEYDETKNGENPTLRRTELVALVNTLDRVSTSLTSLGKLRNLSLGRPIAPEPQPPAWKQRQAKQNKNSPGEKKNYIDIYSGDDDRNPPPSPSFMKKKPRIGTPDKEESIWDDIYAECSLVFRAFRFVLRSWIDMPGKAFKIAILETNRLWAFWLGLPIPERSWEIRLPTMDDI